MAFQTQALGRRTIAIVVAAFLLAGAFAPLARMAAVIMS
jgi:hypothetical protein